MMEKMLVKWCNGRSEGMIYFIKRSTVKDGTMAIGERVKAAWG